jgi:hypothetical protein
MRCTILVLSLAIIYATASPMAEDHIIPEESLFALDDDLSEAQQKVNEMTAAGKSDKDCRKLVTETRKDIETNVNTCQKTMDALPNGKECPSRGQKGVKTATEAKDKADKHYKYTVTEVTKASSASVKFGSRTFSSLTEGKCESFYSSTSYTTAEATYKAAVTARTTAKGAAEQADKELKAAIEAAAKAKKECECQVKKDHEEKFTKLSAADAANKKAWEFACKVECVLDGKANCRCSAAPQCKKAKLTAAVNSAMCVAAKKKDDCPVGYTQVGTKTKNNDYGGACLGQTFGKTKEQCEGDCNARKGCVSFMYGAIAQNGHKAGKCELCNHKKPNNSWGKDFVFCRKD